MAAAIKALFTYLGHGERFLPKPPTSNFDKASLKTDLKMAGFEDSIADIIASRVDGRKTTEWTYDIGREEAIVEAKELLDRSHRALDKFRETVLPNAGRPKHRHYAERIANSSI